VQSLPEIRLLPRDEVVRDMVCIPAARFDVRVAGGFEPDDNPNFPDKPHVPAFWIDRHEVTNGEYRAFLKASGRERPFYWPDDWDGAWRAEWDDLPVTGMSQGDAAAFAAWSGKRLPTFLEWSLAARGPEGRRWPWKDADDAAGRANLKGPELVAYDQTHPYTSGMPIAEERRHGWERYLQFVDPVGKSAGDVTPEGVFDLAGNVREWTITPYARPAADGRYVVELGAPISMGGSYDFAGPVHVAATMLATAGDDSGGFRCVKSVLESP
jgi:formylglycine-generating enzyme required for sulfatase activity